ncbi:MAG: type II secretion system protein [Synergistaceae bacterium]|nr:type II secretion system protein [Synergistaceae bacterium]
MKKHKGFTLIELLLVIVIIAVLAGMMMLSSDEAQISARAATIISDFENIKAAAAAYYLDHAREIDSGKWLGFDPHASTEEESEALDSADQATNELWSYLSNTPTTAAKIRPPKADEVQRNYKYSLGGDPGTPWYVWCYVPDKRVMDKLKARMPSIKFLTPFDQKDNGHHRHHSTIPLSSDIPSTGFIGIQIH